MKYLSLKKRFFNISYWQMIHYYAILSTINTVNSSMMGKATMIILCVTYASLESEKKTFCTKLLQVKNFQTSSMSAAARPSDSHTIVD